VNFLPDAVVAPMPKDVVNGLPLWEIMRQIPPLATGSHQKTYGIDDASSANLFRSFFLLRNHFFDDLPLLVGQVCVIMGFNFHVTPFVEKDCSS